jgi:hypothetical protein
MNPTHIAALSVLFCLGCSAAVHQGEPTHERRVHYRCANGENVEMRFFPAQGVGVLVRNEAKATS